MNYLNEYYSNYDEDGRLLSKHGQVEYLTTMKYIHEVLGNQDKMKILEVGAGTGRYSIALAKEGHEVYAVELIKHNLEVMNSRLEGMNNIRTYEGNALDLSRFADESFDVVLVLGPMYHLYSVSDKEKVLAEATRVTKVGGYVLVAYCMNEATMIQFSFGRNQIHELIKNNMVTEDYRCISQEKDLFEMVRIEEINELNSRFNNLQRLKIVATDGATNYLSELIDNMDDATFEQWLKYHYYTCERQDLIGATNHSLDILKRKI